MRNLGRLSLCVLFLTTLVSCTKQPGPAGEPRLAEDFARRGNTRSEQGELDGAIADFTKAIELDPGLAEAYTNRGIARGRTGDLDGAIADHTKTIELKPQLTAAYLNRGATIPESLGHLWIQFDGLRAISHGSVQVFLNRVRSGAGLFTSADSVTAAV